MGGAGGASHDSPGMPAVLGKRTAAADNKSCLCIAISQRPLPALMRLYLPLLQVCRTNSQPGSSLGAGVKNFSAPRPVERSGGSSRAGCSTPPTPLPATRDHNSQSHFGVFRYLSLPRRNHPTPTSSLRIPAAPHSPPRVIPALTVTLTRGRIPPLLGSAHSP